MMMNDDLLSNEGGGVIGVVNEFPSSSELIPSAVNSSTTTINTNLTNTAEEMNGKSDDDMVEENSDDREGCRSLICDSNGIIVAEMVYRCMICANVVESIAEAQKHYRVKHIGEEIIEPSPLSSSSSTTAAGYTYSHSPSAKFNNSNTNNNNNTNNNSYHNSGINNNNLVNHSIHNSNSINSYNHGYNNSSNTSSLGFTGSVASTPLKSSSLSSPPNKDSGSKVSNSLALMMNGDGNQSDEAEDYSFTSQEMPFLFNHHNNNYDYTPSFISNFDDFDPTQFLSQTFTTEPTSKKSKTESTNGTSSSRGGYVTCAVCNITKFYASVQRRYGQFTCMGCAKFFGRFLMKPRRYYCPNLGTCPLAQSPRCKACLLQACIRTYVIDDKRMKIVNANRPLKRMGPGGGSLPSDSIESPPSPVAPTTGTVTLRNSKETIKKESSLLASSNVTDTPEGRSKSTSLSKDDKLNSPNKRGNNSVNNSCNTISRNSPGKSSVESTASSSTPTSTPKKTNTTNGTNPGRKSAGCRACSGCLAEDCGNCHYCRDKPKFGGANTLKKKCIAKRCLMQGYKIKPSDNLKKIKITRK
ncbi:uncharacterized protein DDB_G0288805-like [Panonychus citri]|uniref:uncharacterized protein DDB_G0288805-like n=1 Tax=Panonychus citri TaxID=50023 RepID=UPI002308248D|nr:uncharacterized protein DDB_G0288805-like [Panonychus citri]